jgi:hypothetical protein
MHVGMGGEGRAHPGVAVEEEEAAEELAGEEEEGWPG